MPRHSSNSSSWTLAAVVALVVVCATDTSSQVRYATGQNVVPVFEGWHRNPDGSFDMVFGYMNRNYEEQIDLPVSTDNTLEPGVPDQGQPTHFYPRRQQFVFRVRVPKDWGKKDLIWTLKVGGKTEKAYASLLPFWELGDFVYQENRGSTATITDKPEPNEPPSIRIANPKLTAAPGQAVALVADVSDDGHPVPPARRAPAPATAAPTLPAAPAATAEPALRRDSDGAVITATGTPGPGGTGPRRENPLTQAIVRNDPGVSLGVTWIVYRGTTDGVRFAPQRSAVVNGKVESKVTFTRPGVYTLRAYADDGIFITPADVAVTVR